MSSIAVKAASTALIRMIRAGKLSAPSIARAAGAMEPGNFRFLRNLGRGQFNLADEVVGNVAGQAGQMVRKLPAHAYVDPQDAYRGVKAYADRVNQAVPTPTGVPLIAPYHAVNPRGAFQQLGNQVINTADSVRGHVRNELRQYPRPGVHSGDPRLNQTFKNQLPAQAEQYLSDLHPGNLGPGGQVLDFSAPGLGSAPSTAKRVYADTPVSSRLPIPGGYDELANLGRFATPQQTQANQMANNAIRQFYALPQAAREAYPGVAPRAAGLPTHPLAGTQTWQPEAAQRALQRTFTQPPTPPPIASNWQPPPPRPSKLRRIAPYVAGGAAGAAGGGLLYDYIRSRGGK